VATLLQVLPIGPLIGRARRKKYDFWLSGSVSRTWTYR